MGYRTTLAIVAHALLLASPGAAEVRVPLQRTVLQETMKLPLRDSAIPGTYNVVLIADAGHSSAQAVAGICSGLEGSFNVSDVGVGDRSFSSRCPGRIAEMVRESRGLDMQHDPKYVAEVAQLHERLSQDGYMAHEFDASNVWARPYRAAALARLLALASAPTTAPAGAGAAPPPPLGADAVAAAAGSAGLRTVCEVGFGAGHSALLFLTHTPPSTRVHTFDTGLARYTLPAHDWLDDRYPERLALYLGESAHTLSTLPSYFPREPCQLVYVDGATAYADVASDLALLRRLADPAGHVLVLAGAGEGTDAARAWRDAVDAGSVEWEASLSEMPTAPLSDRLLVGRFAGAGVGDQVVA